MKDTISVGDAVCFCSYGKVEVGRIARITRGRGEYTIVPVNGNRVKKRRACEIVTLERMKRLCENLKYAKSLD